MVYDIVTIFKVFIVSCHSVSHLNICLLVK